MMVAVIGAGSWGTALSEVLASNGHDVRLWARKPEVVAGVNEQHRNPRYLVDVTLSERIVATTSFDELLEGAGAIVVVTPSHLLRSIAETIAPRLGGDLPVLICSKGVERGRACCPSRCFVRFSAQRRARRFSPPQPCRGGRARPTFRHGHRERRRADGGVLPRPARLRDVFARTSDDPSAWSCALRLKTSSPSPSACLTAWASATTPPLFLIPRGLAEMSRMTVACGGQALTCMGLAGAGDMVATCMSRHSRNRRFGQDFVALGKSLDDFEREFPWWSRVRSPVRRSPASPIERASNCRSPTRCAPSCGEGADAREAAKALAYRPLKSEFYGI